MQNRKIDALDIRKYFEIIIISEDVGMKKPDKNIFIRTCNELKIMPSEAIYVGDNYEIDIVGAINAGLKAIWLNKFTEEHKFKSSIDEIIQIKKLL